ncbi:hypothetical protein D0T53_11220 [Dysgonomonas sp. 216]|uniref:hypothetical protein n=1 Tax=Dysgonomonas sp. 216 TaxID=2302934 RepID=UPI0013CF54D5|nr:hypothetical protein [Dysgonomonas sp. 216]NDW19475.1 hypothetical protein [Dysgonomonas sp. 216]
MKKMLLLALSVLFLVGCTTKGDPTPEGEFFTLEQIEGLPADNSLDGKIITLEGYPGLCKSMNLIKIKKRNKISIHSEANCQGTQLIMANLFFIDGKGTLIFGDEPRNQVIFADDKSITYITDDYQKLPSDKFRFTGKLVFEEGGYYLNDVSIHVLK